MSVILRRLGYIVYSALYHASCFKYCDNRKRNATIKHNKTLFEKYEDPILIDYKMILKYFLYNILPLKQLTQDFIFNYTHNDVYVLESI